MRLAPILLVVALASVARAEEPVLADAPAASVLILKQRVAELEREVAQLRFLLGVYQETVHGQLTAPSNKTLADLATQRRVFEQAHPAPEGYRLDWTADPPAYVKDTRGRD